MVTEVSSVVPCVCRDTEHTGKFDVSPGTAIYTQCPKYGQFRITFVQSNGKWEAIYDNIIGRRFEIKRHELVIYNNLLVEKVSAMLLAADEEESELVSDDCPDCDQCGECGKGQTLDITKVPAEFVQKAADLLKENKVPVNHENLQVLLIEMKERGEF